MLDEQPFIGECQCPHDLLHEAFVGDRDTKWSVPVRARLGEVGIRVMQTPYQAPNANAYAERFVRSINEGASID